LYLPSQGTRVLVHYTPARLSEAERASQLRGTQVAYEQYFVLEEAKT